MKKIILIVISLILIVASMLNLPESVDPQVISGAGDGKNYNVEDVSGFKDVMAFFMGEGVSSTASDPEEEAPTDSGRASSHTSGTLTEESHSTAWQKHKYIKQIDDPDGNRKQLTCYNETKVTFVRSLTAYMDEDKSHYVSKGMMRTSFKTTDPDDEDQEMTMVFDMEVLMDDGELYLLINTFTFVKDDEHLVDFSKIIGKWVRFSDESVDEILSLVDSANKQSLLTVQEIINTGLGSMDRKGEIYSSTSTFYENDDTEIMLDLSDDNISSLSIDINVDKDDFTVTESHFLEFYNIDNTVIRNNISDVTRISNSELENMVGGV